jgi:hypothetical protein
LATAQSFSDRAAEWSRRFHRIAPNRRRIVMVRLAAQTRVWCDRGRVILPRSGGAVFFANATAGGDDNAERGDAEHKMRAFIKRFLMHYGIYRRYPLGRFPALRNAWRVAQP